MKDKMAVKMLKMSIDAGMVSKGQVQGALGKGIVKRISEWKRKNKGMPPMDYLMEEYDGSKEFQEQLKRVGITRLDVVKIARGCLGKI